MGIKEKGQPFLSPKERDDEVVSWQIMSRKKERSPNRIFPLDQYDYKADRDIKTIEEDHGISFFEQIIPRLLQSKKEKEKVKILDIGGGVGIFSAELRKQFGDKVKVYTTGLRKQPARMFRRGTNYLTPELSQTIHPDDLKWRSILELRNFPEFDLIIDTYGEQYHGTAVDSKKFALYIQAIIAKLQPGGIASISPLENTAQISCLKQIAQETNTDIKIKKIYTSAGKTYTVRIYKPFLNEPNPYEDPTPS